MAKLLEASPLRSQKMKILNGKLSLVLASRRRGHKISRPLSAVGVYPQTIVYFDEEINQSWGRVKLAKKIFQIHRKRNQIIITDLARSFLFYNIILSKIFSNKVVVKLRGEPFKESREKISFIFNPKIKLNIKDKIKLLIKGLIDYGSTKIAFLIGANHYWPVSKWAGNFLKEKDKITVVPTPYQAKINIKPAHSNKKIILAVTNFDYLGKTLPISQFIKDNHSFLIKNKIELWVAGDGLLLPNFKAKYGQFSNIKILGRIKNITKLYQKAKIFIHLSTLDGYPSVVTEAQAYGLPVIANKNCGMLDQIDHQQTGYLVNLEKNSTIRQVIIKLLNNEKLRKLINKNSRESVKKNNNKRAIGLKFMHSLNKIND